MIGFDAIAMLDAYRASPSHTMPTRPSSDPYAALASETEVRRAAAERQSTHLAARLKMEMTSKPAAIDRVDRKIMQLQMERLSLGSDDSVAGTKRLSSIDKEIARLEDRQKGMKDKWLAERAAVARDEGLAELVTCGGLWEGWGSVIGW